MTACPAVCMFVLCVLIDVRMLMCKSVYGHIFMYMLAHIDASMDDSAHASIFGCMYECPVGMLIVCMSMGM